MSLLSPLHLPRTVLRRLTPQHFAQSIRMASSAPPDALATTEAQYKPFLTTGGILKDDWCYRIASSECLDQLADARRMHCALSRPLRVLVLYGSNRTRSYSRLLSFEAARLLHHLGCDVRVYDPRGLPLKDDLDACVDGKATSSTEDHPKVKELREVVMWSEAQFWCSPEQHGTLTGIMKTLLDHIPLGTGSVRPTQGKVLAVAQVSGGSQSFNAVNALRILGRWMRMFTIPNQASLPKAYTQFTPEGRMMESSNRGRVVDVVEELVKVSCIFYDRQETFASRWSERQAD